MFNTRNDSHDEGEERASRGEEEGEGVEEEEEEEAILEEF